MISLGLSAADRRRYEATLAQTHRIRITARIHDRDERVISTISSNRKDGKGRVTGGSVNVDMSSDPSRTLELTVMEPKSAPAWLPGGPADYHVFADNFISVKYGVWVDNLSTGPGWVDVPVFWGPITGLSQNGTEVSITAVGKEVLGLEPYLLWFNGPVELKKGQRRTAAVREVLEAIGERRFDMNTIPAKLGKKMPLNRHAQPWRSCNAIMGGEDFQLFYNGRGQVRVRRWPKNRLWTFHDGEPDGMVLTRPEVSYDLSDVRNVVEIMGPEPKGPPQRIRYVARAKAKHPLSPFNLRRRGRPRYMVHVVDSDLAVPELEWIARRDKTPNKKGGIVAGHWGAPSGVKNKARWWQHRHSLIVQRKKKARTIAERQLRNRLRATIEATFDTMPVPHLEEGDPCAVSVDGWHIEFVLKQWTLPLQSDAPMNVGVNKRVPKKGPPRRRKPIDRGPRK